MKFIENIVFTHVDTYMSILWCKCVYEMVKMSDFSFLKFINMQISKCSNYIKI